MNIFRNDRFTLYRRRTVEGIIEVEFLWWLVLIFDHVEP